MNIEILIKLFLHDSSHAIIYAGAAHCYSIADILENDFECKKIIHLGLEYEKLYREEEEQPQRKIRARLVPGSWDFLRESPMQSLDRYKKKGVYEHLLSKDFIDQFISLKNSYCDKQEPEHVLIKRTERLLKQGFNAFIDIANTTIGVQDPRLLDRAVKCNRAELVKLLLRHGANPNIQDSTGQTILFDALYVDNPLIIRALLQHGADKTITDNRGRTAISLAYELFMYDRVSDATMKVLGFTIRPAE